MSIVIKQVKQVVGDNCIRPSSAPLEAIVSLGRPVPSAWSSSVWELGAKHCYQPDGGGGGGGGRGGLREGQTTQTTTTLLITCRREDGIAPNHILRVQGHLLEWQTASSMTRERNRAASVHVWRKRR